MLVLSRKVGERIVIGDDVTLVVSRVSGNRVSIGIEAPDHVKVIRGELKRFRDEFAEPDSSHLPKPATLNIEAESLAFTPRVAR
jgi:carbon storage regulator CsrA